MAPGRLAQTMSSTWLVPVCREPRDALRLGRVPVPWALCLARPVLGTSLRAGLAAELGQSMGSASFDVGWQKERNENFSQFTFLIN